MADWPDTKELKQLCDTLGWTHRMHQHREYSRPNALVMIDCGDDEDAMLEAYGDTIEEACSKVLKALRAAAYALDTYAHQVDAS